MKENKIRQTFKDLLKEKGIRFTEINGKISVGGSLDLRGCTGLTSLPSGLKVGGSLYLLGCTGLTSLPSGLKVGGSLYLRGCTGLTSLPSGLKVGNSLDLEGCNINETNDIWIKRHNLKVKNGFVVLYKRVSKDLKTQEGTNRETKWGIGSTVEHPNWNPKVEECYSGKFHACDCPESCKNFRNKEGDVYISIKIDVNDLYAWPKPSYIDKIAFRKGTVLKIVGKA